MPVIEVNGWKLAEAFADHRVSAVKIVHEGETVVCDYVGHSASPFGVTYCRAAQGGRPNIQVPEGGTVAVAAWI